MVELISVGLAFATILAGALNPGNRDWRGVALIGIGFAFLAVLLRA